MKTTKEVDKLVAIKACEFKFSDPDFDDPSCSVESQTYRINDRSGASVPLQSVCYNVYCFRRSKHACS